MLCNTISFGRTFRFPNSFVIAREERRFGVEGVTLRLQKHRTRPPCVEASSLVAADRFLLPGSRQQGVLILILQLVQLPVNSASPKQLLVRAHLPQLTLVHHQDSIR